MGGSVEEEGIYPLSTWYGCKWASGLLTSNLTSQWHHVTASGQWGALGATSGAVRFYHQYCMWLTAHFVTPVQAAHSYHQLWGLRIESSVVIKSRQLPSWYYSLKDWVISNLLSISHPPLNSNMISLQPILKPSSIKICMLKKVILSPRGDLLMRYSAKLYTHGNADWISWCLKLLLIIERCFSAVVSIKLFRARSICL